MTDRKDHNYCALCAPDSPTRDLGAKHSGGTRATILHEGRYVMVCFDCADRAIDCADREA